MLETQRLSYDPTAHDMKDEISISVNVLNQFLQKIIGKITQANSKFVHRILISILGNLRSLIAMPVSAFQN